MLVRAYTPADREACLAIFDSNTPPFFAANERDEFAQFLDEEADPYFVVESDGNIVACGGYFLIPRTPAAIVTWTMVTRGEHRRGWGRLLLQAIFERLCREPRVQVVKLQTSQHASGFFERLGFTTHNIVEHGYGPDLHRYGMGLLLDSERCEALTRRAATDALPAPPFGG